MPATEVFDAIIIGAGQAGGPLSTALAKSGRRTALIEREHVGGTCINEGCTPTKTMVASARVAYLARRAGDYGVHAAEVAVAMERVRQRKRDIVEEFRGGTEKQLKQAEGLELIMAEAKFTGPDTLELTAGQTARQLTAKLIFINTGGRPQPPEIDGIDSVPFLNSTSIMELDEVPEHLIVLGGGHIGIEFAQMFRRFGSEVTIVQHGAQLLEREDPDIAEAVMAVLTEDGIEVMLETGASAVRNCDGEIVLTLMRKGGKSEIRGSHLLAAAGRLPNTDGLGLDRAGIEIDDQGYVRVNPRLETSVPGIYALGDVKGGPAFTHISYDDFRIIKANLIDGGSRTVDDRLVPYVVYMDPQLGRVGVTEREAKEQGRAVRTATLPMSSVARAREVAEPRGLMKAVVDAETEQILGCAVLGIEGGELMSMLQIAIMGGLPYQAIRDGVFAHPTLAGALSNLFSTLDKE